MAEARRKTTIEKHTNIVTYCIEHDRNCKDTASLYSQVYIWIKKYDADGEINELKCLRRENLRLKRQLEEKDKVVELFKKEKNLKRFGKIRYESKYLAVFL